MIQDKIVVDINDTDDIIHPFSTQGQSNLRRPQRFAKFSGKIFEGRRYFKMNI